MGTTRRDFVKRSAAAGGVLWVTPAISTVSGAWAQTGSVACPNEACPGRAFGLSLVAPLIPPILLANTTSGPAEVLNVGPPVPIVTASVIGADVGGPPCYATSHADRLSLVLPGLVITEGTLISSVEMHPDCTATQRSSIANVTFNGSPLANGEATPNTTLHATIGLASVTLILNEQGSRCEGGVETHFVNALHLIVTNVVTGPTDLIIAHSEVGTTCCTC